MIVENKFVGRLHTLEGISIRDAQKEDYPAIVRLNDGEVEHTSPMDMKRLSLLASLAAYFRVALSGNRIVAFLMAMKDGVPYQNDNYGWFSSRYSSFLYIDRIVVGSDFQGCGIGKLFYQDVFTFSRQTGIPMITCEINTIPSNKRSIAFHAGFGFREVGSQCYFEGRKKVSMQAAFLCRDET